MDALLSASRAFVGVAARSVADIDPDVTLPQYRTLVVLASKGPQKVVDIATELGVAPSTGTRMCDRLIRKGFVRRYRSSTDRRVVRLTLTVTGRDLVARVMAVRRKKLAAIVATTEELWHPAVAPALRAFAAATGEVPEQDWWLGWSGAESGAESAAAGTDDEVA